MSDQPPPPDGSGTGNQSNQGASEYQPMEIDDDDYMNEEDFNRAFSQYRQNCRDEIASSNAYQKPSEGGLGQQQQQQNPPEPQQTSSRQQQMRPPLDQVPDPQDRLYGWNRKSLRLRPDLWGVYVDDGPRKPGEPEYDYRWRMKRARVNMAIERRVYPPDQATARRNDREETRRTGNAPTGSMVWNATQTQIRYSKNNITLHARKMNPDHEDYDEAYARDWHQIETNRKARNVVKREAARAWAIQRARERGVGDDEISRTFPTPDDADDSGDELYSDTTPKTDNDDGNDCWDEDDEVSEEAKAEYNQRFPDSEKQRCKPCAKTGVRGLCSLETKFPCTRCKEKNLRCLRAQYRRLGSSQTTSQATGILGIETWSSTPAALQMFASMPPSARPDDIANKNLAIAGATTNVTRRRRNRQASRAAAAADLRRTVATQDGGPASTGRPRRPGRGFLRLKPDIKPPCEMCMARGIGDWCSRDPLPCEQCVNAGITDHCEPQLLGDVWKRGQLEQRDEGDQGMDDNYMDLDGVPGVNHLGYENTGTPAPILARTASGQPISPYNNSIQHYDGSVLGIQARNNYRNPDNGEGSSQAAPQTLTPTRNSQAVGSLVASLNSELNRQAAATRGASAATPGQQMTQKRLLEDPEEGDTKRQKIAGSTVNPIPTSFRPTTLPREDLSNIHQTLQSGSPFQYYQELMNADTNIDTLDPSLIDPSNPADEGYLTFRGPNVPDQPPFWTYQKLLAPGAHVDDPSRDGGTCWEWLLPCWTRNGELITDQKPNCVKRPAKYCEHLDCGNMWSCDLHHRDQQIKTLQRKMDVIEATMWRFCSSCANIIKGSNASQAKEENSDHRKYFDRCYCIQQLTESFMCNVHYNLVLTELLLETTLNKLGWNWAGDYWGPVEFFCVRCRLRQKPFSSEVWQCKNCTRIVVSTTGNV